MKQDVLSIVITIASSINMLINASVLSCTQYIFLCIFLRKTSASPPVQGAQSAAQGGTQRDGWPSLPPGSSSVNPSSLSTSGIAKLFG